MQMSESSIPFASHVPFGIICGVYARLATQQNHSMFVCLHLALEDDENKKLLESLPLNLPVRQCTGAVTER